MPQDLANAVNKACVSFHPAASMLFCPGHSSAKHKNSITLEKLKPSPSYSDLPEIQVPLKEGRVAPSEKEVRSPQGAHKLNLHSKDSPLCPPPELSSPITSVSSMWEAGETAF